MIAVPSEDPRFCAVPWSPPASLAIEGAIVTIDAMGCQRAIAAKIVDKKADYVLALKGNQTSLHDDVALFVAEQKANGFKDTATSRNQTLDAETFGPLVRSHWAIENSLHWVMDMVFRDDECRLRTLHAPANFVIIKHIAHNLIRKAPGKDSFRLRRKVAAWNDDFTDSLVTA